MSCSFGNREEGKAYLNTEISQSQECFGQAIIKQTTAVAHTTEEIAMHVFETFWFPRYTRKLEGKKVSVHH